MRPPLQIMTSLLSHANLEGTALSSLFFLAMLFYLMTAKFNEDRKLKMVFAIGFVVRCLIVVLDQSLLLFPYGWDDYYSTALILKSNILHGYPLLENITESMHVWSYALFSAFFYTIFGDHQILMRLINAFLSVLAAERLYHLSLELTDDHKISRIASTIMIFFPSFIVYGTLDMRDALLLFLSMDLLLRVIRFINDKKVIWTVFIIELLLTFFLRNQNIILFSGIFLTYLLILIVSKTNKARRLIYLSLITLVLAAVFIQLDRSNFFDLLLDYIKRDMRYRASFGGSSYLTHLDYTSWSDIFHWMPIRFVYFVFGPFPWMIGNIFMVYAFVEVLFFIFCCYLSLTRTARSTALQKPDVLYFLLCYAFIGLLGNAVIDSNFGTAIRHRLNYIFVFFILAAIPLAKQYRGIGRLINPEKS